MSEIAVDVRAVSKRFRLAQGKYNSFKERLIHGGSRGPHEDFWALDDVSFQVQEGETVGILGRNGSGKSTLLKCICGVLQPTSGEVVVRGKLAGLLELGAGFQQDLTGRENIYLNGSLLGLTKKEVDRVFDAIVDFSELEEFIDGPVKFYSSGMYVRLGFAVAVNMDPDILVIDEVLAVGDERFQRKCIDRVKQFQREGRTILLVTHSPDQVRSICDRAVVLSHGNLVTETLPGEAVRIFREGLLEEEGVLSLGEIEPETPTRLALGEADAERPVRITYTACSYPRYEEVGYLSTGDTLTVGVGFHASLATEDVVFSLELRDDDGNCFMRTDTDVMGLRFDLPLGPGLVNFALEDIPLIDGKFTYSIGIQNKGGVLFDWREPAGSFEVMNPGRESGFIKLAVQASLHAAERDSLALMAPEELVHLDTESLT
ncbi:MAG TPA: ABC transporter ATP-binding protein [Acidimicrobiales bacterium]|jgi:ABC-2 type transport system ATP-binding protein